LAKSHGGPIERPAPIARGHYQRASRVKSTRIYHECLDRQAIQSAQNARAMGLPRSRPRHPYHL